MVTGETNRHLGPQWHFARVELRVEPASEFDCVDLVAPSVELRSFGYPECVIFGLLDVLMLDKPNPICRLRIVLQKADYHPIDSCEVAFLRAGRDAGAKILKAIETRELQLET